MGNNEIDNISNKQNGLPDSWHLDSNGKPSPTVFQKYFKLPRSFRNDKKLLEFVSNPVNRLNNFVLSLLHFRKLGSTILLDGDKLMSPEAHAMARFDDGWHLRNEEDLIEFVKLDQEDQHTMTADLLSQGHRKADSKLRQMNLQALANRSNTTVEHAYEITAKCAIETWLRARNALTNWERLDEGERSLLAEVVFCGFTFFGKRALEDATAIEPEVLSYFSHFRGLPPPAGKTPVAAVVTDITSSKEKNHQPSHSSVFTPLSDTSPYPSEPLLEPVPVRASPDDHADTQELSPVRIVNELSLLSAPQSLKQLYALIGIISQEASSSVDVGPDPGRRIADLLDQHLQRLAELNTKVSLDAVRELIECYCHAVLNLTVSLDFANSEQRDLVPVLRFAWQVTVISALENGLPRAWFDRNLDERRHLPEFVERFDSERGRISSAAEEIKGIKTQLVEAKYTAKTALKAQETRKQNEINDANRELETIRVEAAHRLVPEGKTLDDLMEDPTLLQDIDLDVDGLDRAAIKSLMAVVVAMNPSSTLMTLAPVPAPVHVDGTMEKTTAPADLQRQLALIEVEAIAQPVKQPAPALLVKVKDVVIEPPKVAPSEPLATISAVATPVVASASSESVEHVEQEQKAPEALLDESNQDEFNKPRSDLESPIVSKTVGVEDALRHLQYTESKTEAQQAFRVAYDRFSQVPSNLAEAIALHWLEAGHLNVACQFLKDANDSTLITDHVLDSGLLRSAFYGMNLWPKDREALSYTQRDLNLLNHKDLEEQLERKPGGKLVPYLLVCATLQPALFTGGETQAPTLLKVAANYFDGHLQQLISNTADFTQRGGRVDLDTLRDDEAKEVRLAVAKHQDQVNAWVNINAQRTTKWHALRVALKKCSDEPSIAPAIAAIRAGEKGDYAAVRTFVTTYSSHLESRCLMDDLVTQIRADSSISADHIDSPAYSTFYQQIHSLVEIAQSWLLEVIPADIRPKETKDFLQKFHTQLERSIGYLGVHPGHADLEHRAGSLLLLKALTNLQKEIKGETYSTWRFDQTDATFKLPETLAKFDMGDVSVDLRLEWFAMRLTSPNWLAEMIDVAVRHKAYWVKLLLLRQLEVVGEKHDADIDGVNSEIAGTRAQLKQTIEQFRNLSIQGMSVEVITENDHLFNMIQAKEWIDTLSNLKPFVDVSRIEEDVKKRNRGLENLLNSSAAELNDELDQALLNLRTKVGPDAVPEGWVVRARSALARRNLTVVRELINQLQDHINRSARIGESSALENIELENFLKVELSLYALLNEHPNPREAGENVIHEQPGGFDYSTQKAAFKDTILTLMEWGRKGQNKRPLLEKTTYEGIVGVLGFLGFTVQIQSKVGTPDVLDKCEYNPSGDFRRLKVRVARPTLPKGFPLFEGDLSAAIPLNVIFVQGVWNLAGLNVLVEHHGLPDRAVLMVGEPLSRENRRSFANFCRDRKCTIFLLDPVVLSYLATASHLQMTLETFLRVTSAWTFYNPYTKGDARLPTPPEMRFGRENDIASLVEPRGAALVYGGRQLGKTTLLNAAVQEFEKRDQPRNHAFYLRMDGQFQHAVERESMDVKTRVLEHLVSKLNENNLLLPSSQGKSAEERLQAEFQRNGSTRVLFCLDEIDSILNRDAATNFQLVRSLVALVNDPHNRFRVVFAGLNNVNRFRTYANVPLEQLGSPLEVKILPAQDARSLILQPLTALGYTFEEPELVDRIMAFTNRHPSLLHIFCSELVEQMGRESKTKDGLSVIRQSDIENIENNSDVRRLSGERFDMTLNLDKRYTVAVYGLIDLYGKGIGKFTVKQALDVARSYVPEEFEQMRESDFECLLQELVGLGVLREVDKVNHQYALRNQSILQLIGSTDDISHKLQVAMRDLTNHAENALTCHPEATNLAPSPLTLQDEKQILSAKSPDGAPNYSVSIIMGTPALGLSIGSMQDSFSAINEFQEGCALSRYDAKVIPKAEAMDTKRFVEMLNTAIESWAVTKSAVVLVPLEDCSFIDKITDLLSIANERASRATRLKHRLRIVFLLGASAMWCWHSHPWITAAPNDIGGLVELNRWTRHACESLLDQQGLGVTPEQAVQLRDATEGWYLPLMKFIEVRKKKSSATSFNDFAKDFTALCNLPGKDFEKFFNLTGLTSMVWSMPLANKLQEFDTLSEFSDEDLQTAIEFLGPDFEAQISPEQAVYVLRWWTALRVVEVNTKEMSAKAGKSGKVTYRFTPALQRAITEYASTVGDSKGHQA